MLPMLTVSGAPGIVYLNGIFCGETGQAALPVNARGVQYLELRPFDAEVPPAVLRLTFEDGRLTGGAAGDAFAVQWPDGRVEIELREWADEARETPFEDVTGVLPGAEVVKIAEVENTGASEAWIRVGVTKSIRLAGSGRADLSLVSLDINTADWTLGKDGFYYYNTALKPGEVTAPLFTAVTFADEMGNEYQNAAAAVDVAAQAVQTANNGASALDAAGWPKA